MPRRRHEPLEGGHDILRAPDFQKDGIEAKRGCGGLYLSQLLFGRDIADIDHDRQAPAAGSNLAQ